MHTPQDHLPTPHLKMMIGKLKVWPELVAIDEDQDTVTVPANQDADKDFFQDSERQSAVKQKYESEIKQAPWNPQANSENPLMKLGDMIPKATPVYKGFWKNSDVDILLRLDAASEELKSKRRSKKPEGNPLRSHLPMDRMRLM